MNITELFIRRPVMNTLIMLAILACGILGYRDLAVSDLPNVDFPTIEVTAALSGASPDTMSSAVATPLEKQFTTIAGLDSMTSTSSLGATQITLQFDLGRNIDSAALDVQTAITSAANQLPPDMPSPPTFRKVNPADSPILFLALTSATLPLSQVDEYAETLLGNTVSMVPGVAQVSVFGSMKYAVRIQVNPAQLASRQIGIDEVTKAIQDANVNMPMGTLYGAAQRLQHPVQRPTHRRRALQPDDRGLSQWRPGAPATRLPPSAIASRTIARRGGSMPSQASSSPCKGSLGPTPLRL